MLDTSQWPIETLDVLKEVHLDPKNVRLEVTDVKVEADIIEDLFANEDVLSLVKGICQVGYLTHETPVAIVRDGKYVMVEGNRRLAALKAIQNPMIVPDFQARISAFTSLLQDRSTLAKVRVMIAPNQAEADQLIAAIHTGNLRKPWSPSRQAAFFQAQIDAGRDLKELLQRYPTINVRKFVFRAHIINLFKSIEYDDTDLRDYLSTKKWAKGLSTLARIYESKEFLALTGLRMNDDGIISMNVTNDIFKELATAIVRGMYEENINTRSLNSTSSPRFTQLMKELRQIAEDMGTQSQQGNGIEASAPRRNQPSGSKNGTTQSTNSNTTSTSASNSSGDTTLSSTMKTSGQTVNKSTSRKKRRNLDLSHLKIPEGYPEALKLLLGELSEIDVRKYPNGTFLMIRAALEKSIKSFAEAKSIDIKSTGNNYNGRVQLGNALSWLSGYVKNNGPRYLIQVIEGIRTGKLVVYTNSSDSLNAINHNHHFTVDSDQVFSMWTSIDSLVRYLMKP